MKVHDVCKAELLDVTSERRNMKPVYVIITDEKKGVLF